MRLCAAVLACLLLSGGPALAQMDSRDAIALQDQILELRQQIQQLQQQRGGAPAPVYRGGGGDTGGASALVPQLLDRVSRLEDQVRDLRGEIDRLTNAQQQQAADFTKQLGDLKFAMDNSNAGAASPAQRTPQAPVLSPPPGSLGTVPAQPPPTAPTPRTPEMAMQEANAALARRDYAAAEAAAREVIAKRGPRAADAQFLLAQAEMGQRNYAQAAPDFYDAYNRNKASPRAPEALLGVANALVQLGDRPSACDALAKLRAEYPQPRADIREGELATRTRAGCRSP
jgi:TolA-binding protein